MHYSLRQLHTVYYRKSNKKRQAPDKRAYLTNRCIYRSSVPGIHPIPRSELSAMAVVLVFLVAAALAAAHGNAAVVKHTFVVSQINMRHLCKDTLVTVVNGQLPGPTIEVAEGDSVVVHVVNKSPYGVTIHWHGVKQRFNCWADGAGMITQCPLQPGSNFTYRFNITGQEGTLWWHAHVSCLRATLHGAIVIRPRSGPSSYPFPKPDKEIPILIGEWWETDLAKLDKNLLTGSLDDVPSASTINGKLGDLYNCSGAMEDNYILNVDHGKTYLLRIVNVALYSQYYFKIAGHKFTVVAVDANYINPYITTVIAIAPGETVDALIVADAPIDRYYMVAMSCQPPKPNPQMPVSISRGIVHYNPSKGESPSRSPVAPKMPDQHDTITSFYFRGNLTSLHRPGMLHLPINVDEHLFVTLSMGSICRRGEKSSSSSSYCNMSSYVITERLFVANMNNISFQLPAKVSLLEAHYKNNMNNIASLHEFPDRPPRIFNFTDQALTPEGIEERRFEQTSKATAVRRFRYNTSIEIVFQSTAVYQSESNPMHLHGHDFFVLAQGYGNYDAERDVKRYNLVNPPLRNTVLVPEIGWAAIRFVTDNPGVWYIHCHFEFHAQMGMAAAFEVENGPTLDMTLPAPPVDYPKCDKKDSRVAYE